MFEKLREFHAMAQEQLTRDCGLTEQDAVYPFITICMNDGQPQMLYSLHVSQHTPFRYLSGDNASTFQEAIDSVAAKVVSRDLSPTELAEFRAWKEKQAKAEVAA